uniref:Zn(2)-C6 fungal-type domain-containing protein n=1 Tax=Bionectria ochroleuca TaxID=29856 RepID=A0A8H7K6U5_BIOOC
MADDAFPQMQSDVANARPTAKRRKIALACNYCRARKTRCDGRQPACSTCENKGASSACVYEQGTLKTRRYVSTLEARVQKLIDDAAGHVTSQAAIAAVSRSDNSPISTIQGDFSAGEGPMTKSPCHDTIETDAMVIVPSSEGDVANHLGESSPMAFVRSMLRTIGKNDSPLHATNTKPNGSSQPERSYLSPQSQDGDLDPVSLPTRRVADGLVKAFWEYLHPLLPILHRPTFMGSYRLQWMGEDEACLSQPSGSQDDPPFLSTLNIVFAISCQFSDQITTTRKRVIADTFYRRSRRIFADEFLDNPTLATVQLLLLTGVYLQSTAHANRCWNVVGSAIRTAQSLGLHLDRTVGAKNQLQREMERRVWHTCVFLDRQLAVTFGRPTMIHGRSNIPLPLLMDDEHLLEGGEGSQPHQPAQMSSFVYSCKLFEILNEILFSFYSDKSNESQPPNPSSAPYQELSTVMRLNSALDNFHDTLPSYLVISPDSANPITPVHDKITLGAKILYSRFLYIRIFLLRPILLLVAEVATNPPGEKKPYKNESLEQQLALKACSLCVSTVQTLIAHIYKNMDSSYWTSISHKIHYAFSCAIVLVVARLCPDPELNFETASLQTSWSQCIKIFEQYVPHFPCASYVIRILEMLEQRMPHLAAEGDATMQGPRNPMAPVDEPVWPNWAMLDDLLQCEPMGQTFSGDKWPEDMFSTFGWTEPL